MPQEQIENKFYIIEFLKVKNSELILQMECQGIVNNSVEMDKDNSADLSNILHNKNFPVLNNVITRKTSNSCINNKSIINKHMYNNYNINPSLIAENQFEC